MAGFELSKDDWKFINEIDARFPERKIAENFADYTDKDARVRPAVAAFKMNFIERAGWKRIGVPGRVQSLSNHVETLREMKSLVPQWRTPDYLARMFEVHDTAEVITGDFTPVDNISHDEKLRLERLAVNIIFESQPEKIALWEEYEEATSPEARLAKDLDKLEVVFEAEIVEAKHPHLKPQLDEFRESVRSMLRSDRGIQIFAYLENTADQGGTMSKYARIANTARNFG